MAVKDPKTLFDYGDWANGKLLEVLLYRSSSAQRRPDLPVGQREATGGNGVDVPVDAVSLVGVTCGNRRCRHRRYSLRVARRPSAARRRLIGTVASPRRPRHLV